MPMLNAQQKDRSATPRPKKVEGNAEEKENEKSKVESQETEEDEADIDLNPDEISSLKGKTRSGISPFMILAPIVVIVVFLLVILFARMRNNGKQAPVDETPTTSQVQVQEQPQSQQGTVSSTQEPTLPQDIGTQDFTKNTNMESDSPLTNPDQYLEDLYGLTTLVDYHVKNIASASDFVSYTKYRGTWGGGLELYWLNVEYKGRPYVIQVPFKYYKELSDTGIVPVKMEVLQIEGSDGQDRTVISYMCLDEKTLESVLKTQNS